MELSSLSGTGLNCVGKAATSEDGLELNMVEIQSGSASLPKHLAESCKLSETEKQIPPEVPADGYNYSTYNIKVGGEEKVLVTFCESVDHFHCQLYRNVHILDKIWKSIAKLSDKAQYSTHSLGPNLICLAKYTDNQWYRGLIVERSPNLKVHFVDYGDTLAVLDSDICPFPPEANNARSAPVQAVPLGLFNVPADLPQEVNDWFAVHAVGNTFTILVVAKGKKGKLLVELFDGSLNVNALIREKVTKMTFPKMTAVVSKTANQLSASKKTVPNEDCSLRELTRSSVLKNRGQEVHNNNTQQMEQIKVYVYKWLHIIPNTTLDVYASSIAGPDYFWSQNENTEHLNRISSIAKEAAKTQEMIPPELIKPGIPCLALFSDDNQWYRAQVTEEGDKKVHVLFVDYGNESDVEKKDVRYLPKNLLEMAPQAFLCRLDGFESSGSWDETVYDEFYNIIVDKPLKVTVVAMENYSENSVPQHAVTMECDKIVVNKVIEKYWKSLSAEECGDGGAQTKTSNKEFQTGNKHILDPSKGTRSRSMYKQPEVFRSETEMVYASCIAEPKFFWCQFGRTEELCEVSQLAQEAGNTEQDMTFLQSLGPGSHCLALFPDDNLWYRALVVQKDNKTLHVLFVDYGNESDVDVLDTRPLPQNFLDKAPQAFLCHLFGFDESKGSWDDQAYDFFYNLLIDKPLKLKALSVGIHSEIPVPQYSVEIECDGVSINASMQHHWKPFSEGCGVMENL